MSSNHQMKSIKWTGFPSLLPIMSIPETVVGGTFGQQCSKSLCSLGLRPFLNALWIPNAYQSVSCIIDVLATIHLHLLIRLPPCSTLPHPALGPERLTFMFLIKVLSYCLTSDWVWSIVMLGCLFPTSLLVGWVCVNGVPVEAISPVRATYPHLSLSPSLSLGSSNSSFALHLRPRRSNSSLLVFSWSCLHYPSINFLKHYSKLQNQFIY